LCGVTHKETQQECSTIWCMLSYMATTCVQIHLSNMLHCTHP
jgi:hypothetical protein